MEKHTLEVPAGSDLNFSVIVKDETGALFPLAGYSAKLQVRSSVGGTVYSERTSGTNGGITISTETSTISVSIPAADTEKFKSKMLWDLKITNTTSTLYPAGGEILVIRTITK